MIMTDTDTDTNTSTTTTPGKIVGLAPIFGCSKRDDPHFGTTPEGPRKLERICQRYAGTPHLIGLYVTESAEWEYAPDPSTHGRVVYLVRVLPMPKGKTSADYDSGVLHLRGMQLVDRWPFGWPCQVVYYSPEGGPVLRDAVSFALGQTNYGHWAGQFLQGPIDCVPALANRLLAEIRNNIAQDPSHQVRPF